MPVAPVRVHLSDLRFSAQSDKSIESPCRGGRGYYGAPPNFPSSAQSTRYINRASLICYNSWKNSAKNAYADYVVSLSIHVY